MIRGQLFWYAQCLCFCFCPLLHSSMCEAYCRWGVGRLGGAHDRLHIDPMRGIFYFPWHRHQIEGTNGVLVSLPKHTEIHSL